MRIEEIIKAQPPKNSLTLSPEPKASTDEVSIYSGEITTRCIIECVATIKKAFPALPIGFYEVLRERLRANGFSDDRLKDAVNYVIDNCHYPTPTIADFVSYDRKFKVVTYEEMTVKVDQFGKEIWNSYRMIKLPGREKPVWVHVDDYKLYKLETYG